MSKKNEYINNNVKCGFVDELKDTQRQWAEFGEEHELVRELGARLGGVELKKHLRGMLRNCKNNDILDIISGILNPDF